MSRLEELIQELCPDGVEYKLIKDIAWTGIGLATSVTKYKREEGVILLHNSDIKQNKIELKNREFLDYDFVKKMKIRFIDFMTLLLFIQVMWEQVLLLKKNMLEVLVLLRLSQELMIFLK